MKCWLPNDGPPARRLAATASLVAKDIAAELGCPTTVYAETCENLPPAGLCQRVYGGALPVSPALADYATRGRASQSTSKDRVAAASPRADPTGAAPSCSTEGTTALAVARALPRDLGATIVTHSPTVAAALRRSTRASRCTCSVVACSSTQRSPAVRQRPRQRTRFKADIFLLGVTGVHPPGRPDHGRPRRGRDEAPRSRAGLPRPTSWQAARRSGRLRRTRSCPSPSVSGIHHRRRDRPPRGGRAHAPGRGSRSRPYSSSGNGDPSVGAPCRGSIRFERLYDCL